MVAPLVVLSCWVPLQWGPFVSWGTSLPLLWRPCSCVPSSWTSIFMDLMADGDRADNALELDGDGIETVLILMQSIEGLAEVFLMLIPSIEGLAEVFSSLLLFCT